MAASVPIDSFVDLHTYVAPGIVPRRFTIPSMAASEAGSVGGIGVWNHFFPTAPIVASNDIPYDRIVEEMRGVGIENCVICSDMGQVGNPTPSDGLASFCDELLDRVPRRLGADDDGARQSASVARPHVTRNRSRGRGR